MWHLKLKEVNLLFECVTKSNSNFQAYEDNGDEIIGGQEAEENLHPWIARIVGGCAKGLCLKQLIVNSFFLDVVASLGKRQDKTMC